MISFKPVRFRKEIMNELKPIMEVSRSLLDALRTEIDKKKPLVYIENDFSELDSFEIGACLAGKSEEMKKAYAKYIRDHAGLDVTLKNVRGLMVKLNQKSVYFKWRLFSQVRERSSAERVHSEQVWQM